MSPVGLLLLAFSLQMLVAPLLVLLYRPVPWVFPVRQTWGSIAGAALLISMSYPCWIAGVLLTERRLRVRESRPAARPAVIVPPGLLVVAAIIGLVGVALGVRFSPDNAPGLAGDGSGGLQWTASLVFKPFLAIAGVGLLSNALVVASASGFRRTGTKLATGICIAAILVTWTAAELRRAPLLAAALGLFAALDRGRVRPLRGRLIAFLALVGAAFLALRIVRSPGVPVGALFNPNGGDTSIGTALSTEVQSYGGGMQMVAFLLDHHLALGGSLHGEGQLNNLLAPIPRLGEPFRADTPNSLYNSLFLNRTDQVLPLVGQLFLDFGAASVAVGFVALGVVTSLLHRAFTMAGTLLEAFVWAVPSAWLAFSLGSSPTGFFQALVFFSWPSAMVVGYLVVVRRSARLEVTRSQDTRLPFVDP